MPRRFSLFVEDNSIRLLVTSGKRIEKWADIPLSTGLVSAGKIVDEEHVASLIRERLKALKIGTNKVILGLSGLNTLYRLVNMPKIPGSLLPEAMKLEAGRVMPISMDEVYLSYQLISESGEEKRYFLAAFPRNATDVLVRTAQKAGLKPYLMDLAPLSLCRSVTYSKAVVVSVRQNILDAAVIVERVPQVFRSVELSGKNESLSERLPAIAEEIQRIIAFHNSGQPGNTLDADIPILISGDLAGSPDVWPLLSSLVGHSLQALPSPMDTPEGFDAHQFMINIGLALKETKRSRELSDASIIDFNALPETYRDKGVSPFNIGAPITSTLALGAVAFLAFVTTTTGTANAKLNNDLLIAQNNAHAKQAEVTALKEKIQTLQDGIKPLQLKTDSLKNRLAFLWFNRAQCDTDLDQITTSLPETVKLTMITFGTSGVTLNGSSPNTDDIYSYARVLRSTGGFLNVTVASITLPKEGENYEFKFHLRSRWTPK